MVKVFPARRTRPPGPHRRPRRSPTTPQPPAVAPRKSRAVARRSRSPLRRAGKSRTLRRRPLGSARIATRQLPAGRRKRSRSQRLTPEAVPPRPRRKKGPAGIRRPCLTIPTGVAESVPEGEAIRSCLRHKMARKSRSRTIRERLQTSRSAIQGEFWLLRCRYSS